LGETDPFIPLETVNAIASRLQALDKTYKLKIYPNATHGFFCDERSDYQPVAASDAWQEFTQFFAEVLQR
jgi:carboxymethylenebutenolidase